MHPIKQDICGGAVKDMPIPFPNMLGWKLLGKRFVLIWQEVDSNMDVLNIYLIIFEY